MLKKNTILFFWFFLLIDIVFISINQESLRIFSKPFILISLLIWYLNKKSTLNKSVLVIAALIFGWLGDIFLMNAGSLFFMLGLVSFLIAHIFLTIKFFKIQPFKFNKSTLFIFSFLLLTLFSFLLIQFLWPHLGDLKIPVTVYCLVITTMAAAAIQISLSYKFLAQKFYIPGALFFVLSDSTLAFNKFYLKEAEVGIIIMLTYGLAFYFLIKGFKKQS